MSGKGGGKEDVSVAMDGRSMPLECFNSASPLTMTLPVEQEEASYPGYFWEAGSLSNSNCSSLATGEMVKAEPGRNYGLRLSVLLVDNERVVFP